MIKFNDNTVAATVLEMHESGLFEHTQPDNSQILLWIKWNWSPSSTKENFAPIVDIDTVRKEGHTHKVTGENLFFKLNSNGETYSFEDFISKFLKIEQL